jgi:hypothetical protein
MEQKDNSEQQVSRRRFIESVATAGAGLVVAQAAVGAVAKKPAIKKPAPARKPTPAATTPAPKPKEQEVRVGIIGPGNEGRDLLVQCLLIPGIRFVAVCDIWPYSQHYAAGILRAYGQHVNVYTDYQDMLDKEKSMDAVIIATPDWMHSEITVACLKSGKHVYCEKEMSNTVEGARQMVLAQRQTGKLLQIGHQRRSNPRYEHVFNLITKDKTCGRMTHTYVGPRPRSLTRPHSLTMGTTPWNGFATGGGIGNSPGAHWGTWDHIKSTSSTGSCKPTPRRCWALVARTIQTAGESGSTTP